jgi:hypothetical protein
MTYRHTGQAGDLITESVAEYRARALYEAMERHDDLPPGPPWHLLEDVDRRWYQRVMGELTALFEGPRPDKLSCNGDIGGRSD